MLPYRKLIGILLAILRNQLHTHGRGFQLYTRTLSSRETVPWQYRGAISSWFMHPPNKHSFTQTKGEACRRKIRHSGHRMMNDRTVILIINRAGGGCGGLRGPT